MKCMRQNETAKLQPRKCKNIALAGKRHCEQCSKEMDVIIAGLVKEEQENPKGPSADDIYYHFFA